MKIPMPFPKCKSCGESSPRSYHRNCSGRMLIETTTDVVYCEKCEKCWGIWDSTYYCTCGSSFTAEEIHSTLLEVLACCKICAEEIAAQDSARSKREKISEISLRAFLSKFFEQIGYAFGVAIGTIIDSVTAFILKR